MEANNKKDIILRLLNGALRGCEFTLSQSGTVFVMADENDLMFHHKGNQLPDNMIFIPSSENGINFEIFTNSNEQEKNLTLREFHEEDNIKEYSINTHEVITVGKQKFALRRREESFSDDIIHPHHDNEEDDKTIPTEPETITPVLPEINEKKKKNPILFCVFIIFLLGISGLVSAYFFNEEKREVNALTSFLDYGVGNYDVINSRDNIMYLVADTDNAATWAKQTLVRKPFSRTVRVFTSGQIANELSDWMSATFPNIKFHRIQVNSARNPVLELSLERSFISDEEREAINTAMRESFPYIDKPVFAFVNDSVVSDTAEEGLKKIALDYTRINNPDSVSFLIRGEIDDSALERVKAFIENYSLTWGGQYVNFSVEIRDDWMKGQSFKYGNRGYIKPSPGHWYFPTSS